MRIQSIGLLALAILCTRSISAADQTVSVPTGWISSPYRFSASSQRTELILYPAAADPFVSSSKVLIVPTNGTSLTTELSGKVFAISSSPSGTYVLAHHDGPDVRRVTLLSASTGAVVWTKSNDQRQFAFSATGSVLFAHKSHGETPAGKEVEIFDVAGNSKRRFTFDTSVTSAVVADDGSSIVVVLGRTIACFRVVSDGTIVSDWSFDLPSGEPDMTHLQSLGTSRFVAREELGSFRVMRWNGATEYVYSPSALDAADPARTFEDYAAYVPFPTPLTDKLLLFRNSPDALILNLATGALTSKAIDIAAPAGFELMNLIDSGRLVFASPTQLKIRSISF